MTSRSRDHKMHGSTPKGRSRHYTYYTTIRKVRGTWYSARTQDIESQIPDLLSCIRVDLHALPAIRAQYREQLAILKGPNLQERRGQIKERLERLHNEEAALARLYAQGKLTDSTYDSLYREWQAKVFECEQEMTLLESGQDQFIDELEQGLALLTCAPSLFDRLETVDQTRLLQILFRRIIIDTQGKIVDFELNSPFMYLTSLHRDLTHHTPVEGENHQQNADGSRQIQTALSSRNYLELSIEAEKYIETVSFPHRNTLDGLLHHIVEEIRDGFFVSAE